MFSRWTMFAVAATLVASGCATDPEKQLVGKWKGDEISSTFAAVKLKEDSGASLEDAKNAAKMMASTYVELRPDKTFTSGMGGATLTGNWAFTKESRQVVLTGTKLVGMDQQEVPGAAPVWTAYLSDSGEKLAFYPVNPEGAAMVRESKIKGAMTKGISLYK